MRVLSKGFTSGFNVTGVRSTEGGPITITKRAFSEPNNVGVEWDAVNDTLYDVSTAEEDAGYFVTELEEDFAEAEACAEAVGSDLVRASRARARDPRP
eukprot:tig00020996_g16935.t1